MKQRMREMDYIRAVSALSIIMIHMSGVYVSTSRGAYALNQLTRFAVPVFILISGLLLALSGYEFVGISGYIKFVSKRLRKIFIPYVLWSVIYILFKMRDDLSPIWSDPGSFLADTGKKLLYGSGHIHLYFIVIIFQLYLLYPLLHYLMKYHKRLVLVCSFLLTLAFQTGTYLQAMKIIIFPAPVLPNYMFFPTWVFFFVFGMYFFENLEAYKRRIAGRTALISVVWVASFLLLLADSRLTGTFDLSIKPVVLLYSLTTFLFMYSISLKFKDSKLRLLKSLDWISVQSFTIYLSHLFIAKIILLLTGQPAGTGIWTGFPGMLALYVSASAGTLLFTYAVSLTPVASMLGGVKTARKNPTAV